MAVNPVSFSGDAAWQEKINRKQTYIKKETPAAASSIRYERKEEGSFLGKTFKLAVFAGVIAGLLAANHKAGWLKAEPEAEGMLNKFKGQIDNAGSWVCKKFNAASEYVKNFFPAKPEAAAEKTADTFQNTAGASADKAAEAVKTAAEETIDAGEKALAEGRQNLIKTLGNVLEKKEAAAQAAVNTEKAAEAVKTAAEETIDAGEKALAEGRQNVIKVLGKVCDKKAAAEQAVAGGSAKALEQAENIGLI